MPSEEEPEEEPEEEEQDEEPSEDEDDGGDDVAGDGDYKPPATKSESRTKPSSSSFTVPRLTSPLRNGKKSGQLVALLGRRRGDVKGRARHENTRGGCTFPAIFCSLLTFLDAAPGQLGFHHVFYICTYCLLLERRQLIVFCGLFAPVY